MDLWKKVRNIDMTIKVTFSAASGDISDQEFDTLNEVTMSFGEGKWDSMEIEECMRTLVREALSKASVEVQKLDIDEE